MDFGPNPILACSFIEAPAIIQMRHGSPAIRTSFVVGWQTGVFVTCIFEWDKMKPLRFRIEMRPTRGTGRIINANQRLAECLFCFIFSLY